MTTRTRGTTSRTTTRSPSKGSVRQAAIAAGYRSGLEEATMADLRSRGAQASFETLVVRYEKPASRHKYTPDFVLPNHRLVETKGRFLTADRQKHLLVRKQHPDLWIGIVFSNSRTKISKGSKTSYGDWCAKHGIPFADKTVPQEWIDAPACPNLEAALKAACA